MATQLDETLETTSASSSSFRHDISQPFGTSAVGDLDPGPGNTDSVRGEIDTSAPFESVKEAVSRFGGIGFWKPHSHNLSLPSQQNGTEVIDIAKVEEQAAQLEKDLIVKERETLNVLKELESTKTIVEELKVKIQKEASEVNVTLNSNSDEPKATAKESNENSVGVLSLCPSSTPGFILMELKQAKLNLTRTTNDLADIRATVESYNKKIEKERISLERTRQRLSSGSLKISSLEEEISQTKRKLNLAKDNTEINGGSDSPMDISMELQRLSSETEEFMKIGEAAKSEVLKAMVEIEQTKTRIKTAEIRLIAAKKMKEAARATEAVALADIKALSRSDTSSSGVTLTFEEYSALTSKARRAEEASKKRVMEAMVEVDEANVSKKEVLKKVEEATEEIKSSKKVLQEALYRVEAANRGKLAVEEALRKWRSEHGQKRRSVNNSTKFKNSSCPSYHRREGPRLVDLNGLNLVNNESTPVLRPTLSIGQILSRKLLLTEEFETENSSSIKRKVSLGQMLSKSNCDAEKENSQKQIPAKRKKFGFGRISLLVAKQNKKKKKQTASSRRTCG
ncbi:hypothetical protein LguiB_015477 [Lonicera macranthoides]